MNKIFNYENFIIVFCDMLLYSHRMQSTEMPIGPPLKKWEECNMV